MKIMKRSTLILSFLIFLITQKIFAASPVIDSIYPIFGYTETNNSITIIGRNFAINCVVYIISKDNFDSPPGASGMESVVFVSSKKLEVKTKNDLAEGDYYIKIVNSSEEFNVYKKIYKIISKGSTMPSQPPVLELTANSVAGDAPLKVDFTVTGRDYDGKILNYDWDFEGKGDWNKTTYSETESHQVSYTYTNPGGYTVKVRVVDNNGEKAETKLNITVLNKGSSDNLQPAVTNKRSGPVNQLPVLELIAEPNSGKAPLNVTLTVTGEDPDGTILNYEWDFEGKGDWNKTTYSNLSSHKVDYTYKNPGNYNAKVRAVDNDGGKAEAQVNIGVEK
ncbi:MAG: PKD domain-containing protein [bacterium]|nr:PKD domain-containing protein [bacterium]